MHDACSSNFESHLDFTRYIMSLLISQIPCIYILLIESIGSLLITIFTSLPKLFHPQVNCGEIFSLSEHCIVSEEGKDIIEEQNIKSFQFLIEVFQSLRGGAPFHLPSLHSASEGPLSALFVQNPSYS